MSGNNEQIREVVEEPEERPVVVGTVDRLGALFLLAMSGFIIMALTIVGIGASLEYFGLVISKEMKIMTLFGPMGVYFLLFCLYGLRIVADGWDVSIRHVASTPVRVFKRLVRVARGKEHIDRYEDYGL